MATQPRAFAREPNGERSLAGYNPQGCTESGITEATQHARNINWGGHGTPLQYILAWKIPWTEKPGGLQSTGSQRVRYN